MSARTSSSAISAATRPTWRPGYVVPEERDPAVLTDLVVAETVYVLESFYEAPRGQVAEAARSLLATRSVVSIDAALLLRAVEVCEIDRLDFAEAYLVACAESTGVNRVASFYKSIDRVPTVERIEPPVT